MIQTIDEEPIIVRECFVLALTEGERRERSMGVAEVLHHDDEFAPGFGRRCSRSCACLGLLDGWSRHSPC